MSSGIPMQPPAMYNVVDNQDPQAMFALGLLLGGKLTAPAAPQVEVPPAWPQVPIAKLGVSAPIVSGFGCADSARALFGASCDASLQDQLAQFEKLKGMQAFQSLQQPSMIPPISRIPSGPSQVGLASLADVQLQFAQRQAFQQHQSTEQTPLLSVPALRPAIVDKPSLHFPQTQVRDFTLGSQPAQGPKTDGVDTHSGGTEKVEMVTPRNRRKQEERGPIALTRSRLEELFNGSLQQASKVLGICPTAIKKACRRFGILKWPYKSPNPGPKPKRIRSADRALLHVSHGAYEDALGLRVKREHNDASAEDSDLGSGEDRSSPRKAAPMGIAFAAGNAGDVPALQEPERCG